MSARIHYLDNRDKVAAVFDDLHKRTLVGEVDGVGIIVIYGAAAQLERSIYATARKPADRDRLVMGAQILIHSLVMEEEQEADDADDEDDDERA